MKYYAPAHLVMWHIFSKLCCLRRQNSTHWNWIEALAALAPMRRRSTRCCSRDRLGASAPSAQSTRKVGHPRNLPIQIKQWLIALFLRLAIADRWAETCSWESVSCFWFHMVSNICVILQSTVRIWTRPSRATRAAFIASSSLRWQPYASFDCASDLSLILNPTHTNIVQLF